MAKVAAQIKVMPTSPDVDLDSLRERLEGTLPENAKISNVDTEDVAFGLTALIVTVVVPDEAGGTEAVEEAFGDVDDVESVSVEDVGRL
ncbi:MAG: elongation factor 1-beta [Halobacteria archaeon]|nr:elongation factor 1-beta [Halobacteria archaeon]